MKVKELHKILFERFCRKMDKQIAVNHSEKIISHILGYSDSILLHYDSFANKHDLSMIEELVERRESGEPLAYILGYEYFWNGKFFVSESTLIPRPDTEVLVESIVKYAPNKDESYNILDLGTGTGCILVSVLQELKKAYGVGIDINQEIIDLAEKNAELNHVSERTHFEIGSWFSTIKDEKFDIIISNPPYIDLSEKLEESLAFEPESALYAPNNGLENYKIIAQDSKKFLTENGFIALEIGYMQANDVTGIFKSHGFGKVECIKDLAGRDRVLIIKP